MPADCQICFDKIDPMAVAVHCPKCSGVVCEDCFSRFLTHCREGALIPKCPRFEPSACDKVFLYSDLRPQVPDPLMGIYYRCVYNHCITTNRKEADSTKLINSLIVRIKQERSEFIEQNMPRAIAALIGIALRGKLNNVRRERERLTGTVTTSKKNCMFLHCNGRLSEEFRCIKCDTQFCPQCEKEAVPGHHCRQEDIDSVSFILNMVQCPGCGQRIERSEGCDNMSCSVCHTKFFYSTGERGGYGSYNKATVVKEVSWISQFEGLDDETMTLLRKLEEGAPKPLQTSTLVSAINKVRETLGDGGDGGGGEGGGDRTLLRRLSRLYEEYVVRKTSINEYVRILRSVEKLYSDKELQRHHISTALDEVRKIRGIDAVEGE